MERNAKLLLCVIHSNNKYLMDVHCLHSSKFWCSSKEEKKQILTSQALLANENESNVSLARIYFPLTEL
jgi:hypothetical protein